MDERVLSFMINIEECYGEPSAFLICAYCDRGYVKDIYPWDTLREVIEGAEKHLQEKHPHD